MLVGDGADKCIIMHDFPGFFGTTPTPEHWRLGDFCSDALVSLDRS